VFGSKNFKGTEEEMSYFAVMEVNQELDEKWGKEQVGVIPVFGTYGEALVYSEGKHDIVEIEVKK
jgi:hypothetical protein